MLTHRHALTHTRRRKYLSLALPQRLHLRCSLIRLRLCGKGVKQKVHHVVVIVKPILNRFALASTRAAVRVAVAICPMACMLDFVAVFEAMQMSDCAFVCPQDSFATESARAGAGEASERQRQKEQVSERQAEDHHLKKSSTSSRYFCCWRRLKMDLEVRAFHLKPKRTTNGLLQTRTHSSTLLSTHHKQQTCSSR